MKKLGQEEAAKALCVALYPQVFSAIALYVGDRLVAEDLAQETMLRLWRERAACRRWNARTGGRCGSGSTSRSQGGVAPVLSAVSTRGVP